MTTTRRQPMRADVIIGFENGYPKHADRELICNGGGLWVQYRNKVQKVCYFGQRDHTCGEFILERLICD